MSNPELCCNCAQWDTCKSEGALPNDYCGMYESKEKEKSDELQQETH